MTSPLVSAIVPVFNGERFLAAALDSILTQDYRPLEVVVVDDGSTDGSAAIAQSRAVRYLAQPNGGPAAARNAGVDAARGSLLAFLDQDDEWLPATLRKRVEALRGSPELGFVLGRLEVVLEPGTSWPHWLDPRRRTEPAPGYCPGTLLVRREAFAAAGGFDPRFVSVSDAEWLLRARRAGIRGDVLDDVVLRYRLHAANHSHDRELFRSELFRALRTSVRAEATA